MDILEQTNASDGIHPDVAQMRVECLERYIQSEITPESIVSNARTASFEQASNIYLLLGGNHKSDNQCRLTVRIPVVDPKIKTVSIPGFGLYFVDDVLVTYDCTVSILQDSIEVTLGDIDIATVLCIAESESGVGSQLVDVDIKNVSDFKSNDFDAAIVAGINSLDFDFTFAKHDTKEKKVKIKI